MDFTNLIQTKAAFEAARQKLNEDFKQSIATIFQSFFAANPEVYAFAWTQYTPYFNDGEPCEFGVNEIYAYNDTEEVREAIQNGDRSGIFWGELGTEDDETDYVVNTRDRTYDHHARKMVPVELEQYEQNTADLIRALNDFNDEFQYAFGDHVSVLVTRDGIDVEEFDHD